MAKTHFKKLMNPNYLGAFSIEDGKELILTIKEIRQESVIGADGKKEDCAVCYWKEKQLPMIMNATNMKTCEKVFRSPYIEDWYGKKVVIGTEKVKAFGTVTDALRIRSKAAVVETPVGKCSVCGCDVYGAFGMTAEQWGKYCTEKKGVLLCGDCSKTYTAPVEEAKHED